MSYPNLPPRKPIVRGSRYPAVVSLDNLIAYWRKQLGKEEIMTTGTIKWYRGKGWIYTADNPTALLQEVEARGLSRGELLHRTVVRMRNLIKRFPSLRFQVRIFDADGQLADVRVVG